MLKVCINCKKLQRARVTRTYQIPIEKLSLFPLLDNEWSKHTRLDQPIKYITIDLNVFDTVIIAFMRYKLADHAVPHHIDPHLIMALERFFKQHRY